MKCTSILYYFFSGQLTVLLRHLNTPSGPSAAPEVVNRIRKIQAKADHVSMLATPYIKQNQAGYFKRKSCHRG